MDTRVVVCDYAGGCQSEGAGGQLGRVGVCVCVSLAHLAWQKVYYLF